MKGTKNSEARARYNREIGSGVILIGFEWGEGSHLMSDFEIDLLGEVDDSGEDSERGVGWVIYNNFNGRVGDIIKLKRNWSYQN
tara:strand:- start:62 stop:313 length:252 start_codon:yes stop_codon:yes gene_type:complete